MNLMITCAKVTWWNGSHPQLKACVKTSWSYPDERNHSYVMILLNKQNLMSWRYRRKHLRWFEVFDLHFIPALHIMIPKPTMEPFVDFSNFKEHPSMPLRLIMPLGVVFVVESSTFHYTNFVRKIRFPTTSWQLIRITNTSFNKEQFVKR